MEFEETVEEAVLREAREETGHDVALHAPLVVHSFVDVASERGRPFKSVRGGTGSHRPDRPGIPVIEPVEISTGSITGRTRRVSRPDASAR